VLIKNLTEFTKISMLESLKKFIIFFKNNKHIVILKILTIFNGKF
jgi:hypothetical protein